MSKRPSKRAPAAASLFEWRIIELKKTPASTIGFVNASDQEQAIAKAVESFRISEQDRWRLEAYRVKSEYEILVNGTPRDFRIREELARATATIIKRKHPDAEVMLRDLGTGEVTVIDHPSNPR